MPDYATPGPLTQLGAPALAGTPVEVCFPVHALVIQPGDAAALGLPDERLAENNLRPAHVLVERLRRLDPAPLDVLRPPERRVVGTCRHFAVLATALLRGAGVAARARCGFATYFQPGQALDHWIVEYRDGAEWVRMDPELLGGDVLDRPERLAPGQFLTGGEAWIAFRRNEIDAATFGVHGTENFGPAEIQGNAVRDLAALNKLELLPWDEWGRMTEAYEFRTRADYDELLDQLAAACASDDPAAIEAVYARPEFTVPDSLVS